MKTPSFTGPFAPMCEAYVAQKRALGFKYEAQAFLLRMFDDFCKDYEVRNYMITKEIATAWCKKRLNEKDSTRHNRVGEMQRFAVFLCKQGHPSYLLSDVPKTGTRHIPYIFTQKEIAALFDRLDHLEPTPRSPYRHIVYPLLFRVLYGCGLRISEALQLRKCDVDTDNGVLHILCGKNDIERIVPMSFSLTRCCKRYIQDIHLNTPDDMPFFYTKDKKVYSKFSIGQTFREFLWDIGIPYRGVNFEPRLHDLRHTFACHSIQKWAESDVPISVMLPVLSKYLGHTSISATQWYLRLTAEVYPHIRKICETELGWIYADILNFSREETEGFND